MRKLILILLFSLSFNRLAWAEELKIGAILGLSSWAQVWAENARMGIELALDQARAEGKLKTINIKVIYEDSQSSAAKAVSAYRKLVERDKVSVIIGDVWAYLTNPLIPLSERDKVILISPTVMDKSVEGGSLFFFTFGHSYSSLEKPIRNFFALHPEISKIGALSYQDVWNSALIDVFSKAAKEEQVAIVKDLRLTEFAPDFKVEINKLRQSGAEAVFSTWQADTVLRRMAEVRWQVPFVCSSDTVEAMLIRSKDRTLFEGTYFVDWRPRPAFIVRFKKKFGKEPITEAHNSYEIIRSIIKALDMPGESLRQKLLKVHYRGVGGAIDFSKAPFVNQGQARLFKVTNGLIAEVQRPPKTNN